MLTKTGNILKKVRDLQGFKQQEIASRIGIDYTSIAKCENGVPALSRETVGKICHILSVNEAFIYGQDDYIFRRNSFLKMRVKGLNARLDSLDWLRLLTRGVAEVKGLLLTRKETEKILAGMIKDSMNSVFLVAIDIPLNISSFVEKWYNQEPEVIKNKKLKVVPFFDRIDHDLADYGSFSDIEGYSKDMIAQMIEKEFEDDLSTEENDLIKKIRRKFVNIQDLSDYVDKNYGI